MRLTQYITEDSGSLPDISTKIYKWDHLERVLDCTWCRPHRGENGHWDKPRKKKAWQLNPARRHVIRRHSGYGRSLRQLTASV